MTQATRLVRGQPVSTQAPLLSILPDLPAGRHRFQLVVIDAAGRRSLPDTVTVIVRRPAGHAGARSG